MRRPFLALLAMSATAAPLQAQIAFGGRPLGLMPDGPRLLPPAELVLPAVDAGSLMLEDAARELQGIKAPYRFGFNHAADAGTANAGTWQTLRNGDRVWRLALTCPGAYSINFRFDRFVVPEGGRVFVYNDQGRWFGAFTARSANGRERLGVSQMPGERITIEYHEPASVAGQGLLHIDRVTHAYRDILRTMREFGESGPCNINVICDEGDPWRDQIRSVACITTNGSGFCTGTLLNNCAQDSTPYMLTANHCVSPDVSDWVFRFNWDSPDCDPTADGPIDQTVSGCELLITNPGTDMAFLRLSAKPPADYDVFYSGWDRSGTTPDSVCGIHHPRGDIKKISLSYGPFDQTNIDVGNGPADCWRVAEWDAGTTEPGSSGSALFNGEKLVIGQLYGGQAACGNSVNDYYGRFDISFDLLQTWLGDCGEQLAGLGDESLPEPIHYDAAVTSITEVPALLCNASEIAPRITLKNNGDVDLLMVLITYGLQGGPAYTFTWNGVLHPGETANVPLPAIPVPPGSSVLAASTSFPNGLPDQVPANDGWQYGFTASTPGGNVTLRITLDNYGTDITWWLSNDQGIQLYTGGPYADFQSGQLVQVPFCLTNGCYTFRINDFFGDGICCEQGQGHYEIVGTDGAVLVANNGQYGEGRTDVFCLEALGIAEARTAPEVSLQPNPAEGMALLIAGNEAIRNMRILDATGRVLFGHGPLPARGSLRIDLTGFAPGTYLVVAEGLGGRSVERLIVR